MSNENLLKEGTVRRFMKLAGNQAIAGDFLKETYYQRDELNEAPEDEELGGEEFGGEELPEEPMGAELEAEAPEEGEEDLEGSVEGFARDVLDAIKDVAEDHGVEMEVEEMEEPEEIEVGEMEAPEEGEDLDLGGAEGGELDAEEELPPEELAEINYVDEGTLMETVYKRVASRILREKREDDMVSVLAEKVSKRLSRKRR
tara:strand:+ start:34648 stop:35250 length:603 start_codon:yes stop_codon:yes gene_type:complete